MTQYSNPKMVPGITAEASGAIYLDRQVTQLGDPVAFPKALQVGDQVQVGVIPAGHVMVPYLSAINIPKLDTNAAATGTYSLGTEAKPALFGAGINAGQVKQAVLTGTDVIGDPEKDIPLYLTLTASLATQVAAGRIVFDVALRAWRSETDQSGGAL
jgi:hypothetical protein